MNNQTTTLFPSAPIGDQPNVAADLRTFPHAVETLGSLPNSAEPNGRIPQSTEQFGTRPNPADDIGNPPKTRGGAEARQGHTVTVKEAARMFEAAGVPRTERSVVAWCNANRHEVARLDGFYDESQHRWFITPESIERAIAEEKSKARRNPSPKPEENASNPPPISEPRGSAGPQPSQNPPPRESRTSPDIESELMDLRITNRAKDYFIEQLRNERANLELWPCNRSHKMAEHGRIADGAANRLSLLD